MTKQPTVELFVSLHNDWSETVRLTTEELKQSHARTSLLDVYKLS